MNTSLPYLDGEHKVPMGIITESKRVTRGDGTIIECIRMTVTKGGIYDCIVLPGDDVWILMDDLNQKNSDTTSPPSKPASKHSSEGLPSNSNNRKTSLIRKWLQRAFDFLARHFHWT